MGLAKLAAAAAAQQPGGSPQRKGSAGRRGEPRGTAAGGMCWYWRICTGAGGCVSEGGRTAAGQFSRGVLAELGSVGMGPPPSL